RNGTGSAAPKRNTTMMSRVKQILFFKTGSFQAFLMVSNILNHLSLSACLFNFFFGRCVECGGIYSRLFAQVAVAQNLDAVQRLFNQAGLNEKLLGNNGIVVKTLQVAYVHDSELFCKDVVEASLRNTSLQWHLAAFKTWPYAAAGT